MHQTNCQVALASVVYLDKHSTLDPVMVSVVSSIPTGGNLLKFFKPFDVNFGLKCKFDLIVKNSSGFPQIIITPLMHGRICERIFKRKEK